LTAPALRAPFAVVLPDLAPLLALPADTLRALPARLAAIGLDRALLSPVSAALRAVHPVLRPAARAWHLRRMQGPAAIAARLLCFEDAVPRAGAEAALGDLFAPLADAGLFATDGDAVRARLVLGLAGDLALLSDARAHGEDAVLPPGDGTLALVSAAFPGAPVARLLDVGCGSGTCALLLARRAERVVATDIHPRALDLTRLNAAMNGLGNVETRLGSLFEPVAGEAFDLVVSQPPFIPQPSGAATSTFLYGGRRGDELPLALVAHLAPHVAPGGRAVLLVEWPVTTDPVATRVRHALAAPDLDVLVLEAPHIDADEHAAEYAATMTAELGEAFERDATMRLEHFEREGIAAVVPTFVVVGRPACRAGFTDTQRITARARGKVTAARVDRLVAARATGADPKRLLAATLRVPEGTTLVEEQVGPGMDKPSKLHARFADALLAPPAPLTPELLAAVTMVHEEADVLTGLCRFAEATETTPEQAVAAMLPQIAQALRAGVLEVA
jgi:SAM-dependent methyltransferase